jgi:predicted proteasome-type protease
MSIQNIYFGGNFAKSTPDAPYITIPFTTLTFHVNVRNIGQGEARHRKYKRLKLGGGQAYDRSND